MSLFPQTADPGNGPAFIGVSKLSKGLLRILEAQPGDEPDYELAKSIYAEHPLGAKIAEAPVRLAQSQEREIKIPGGPEEELKKAFASEWKKLGNNKIESGGADRIIRQLCTTSRIYGIATAGMVCKGYEDLSVVIPKGEWWKLDLQFSIWDPLNTAGSLVLNQDPAAVDFMKPTGVKVGGHPVHDSRVIVKMQEMPVWIKWSNSAFGFVGRSVYQRPLYPLKSFIMSMITNNLVQEKAGVLVYSSKPPGSIIDKITLGFAALKRAKIKGSKTGEVLNIGLQEKLESINLQMLAEPVRITREHIKQDIASATPMPAALLAEETLTAGFGEGTNDYKIIASFIDGYRAEINPVYDFFDEICMYKAWNRDFYETIQTNYPEYKDIAYETAFHQWCNAFSATWPSFMQEEPSKKAEVEKVVLDAAVGAVQVLVPGTDPVNLAKIKVWFADVINNRKELFSQPLILDEEALAEYKPEPGDAMVEPDKENQVYNPSHI